MGKLATHSDGTTYYLDDAVDPTVYGAVPTAFDPTAPFGSAASVPPSPPPQSPIADGGMSMVQTTPPDQLASYSPPQPSAPEPIAAGTPMASGPQQIEPVNVQGNPYDFMQRGQPAITPLENRMADQAGYKYVPGHKAQQQIDPFYQNYQRTGAYDPTEQNDLLANAEIDQQLANQTATDAGLEANRARIESARRDQALIDHMQREQASRNAAIRDQVEKDQAEWEKSRQDFEKDARDGDSILGTPQGVLSTIFGMLAIGLAARGSRQNLDATIGTVNNNIDRQVQLMQAATKAKGEIADNAYARYLRSYGNEEQAQAATKALMLDRAAKQAELTGLRANDPTIRANGDQAAAELRARLAQQQAIISQESQGKATQVWNLGQQARAASGGYYRPMTAEEQDKRDARFLDVQGKGLENQGKANENARAMGSNVGEEDFSKYNDTLQKLAAAQNAKAKLLALKDRLQKSGDKSFAGMSDDGITPLTAKIGAKLTQATSNRATREASDFNAAVGDVMFARFGAGNNEQKESAKDEVLVDYTKQGVDRAIDKMIEDSDSMIREYSSVVPQPVQTAYQNRRVQNDAQTHTTAQPGRVIPTAR